MEASEIKAGHCYESLDGSIRKVTEIAAKNNTHYVTAVSRLDSDPPGAWPGWNGAYLRVFASLCTREVPCPG